MNFVGKIVTTISNFIDKWIVTKISNLTDEWKIIYAILGIGLFALVFGLLAGLNTLNLLASVSASILLYGVFLLAIVSYNKIEKGKPAVGYTFGVVIGVASLVAFVFHAVLFLEIGGVESQPSIYLNTMFGSAITFLLSFLREIS